MISAVALLACVVFKGDGLRLYVVLAGIGGYALIMLLVLTSGSVIAFFRRELGHGENLWRVAVAPSLASAGLVVALVLATKNVATMIGGNQSLANVLVGVFFGLLILGVVVALVLRRAQPDVYRRIGRQEL